MARGRRLAVFAAAALVWGAATSDVRAEAQVAEATPAQDSGWLVCLLRAVNLLDDRTQSTVESGLPGVCVYRVMVRDDGGREVTARSVELRLHYDLWEDVYRLQGPWGERTFSTLAQADSAWSRPQPLRLGQLSGLDPRQRYQLEVDVAVSPLLAEDRARLFRYVTRSSGEGRDELNFNLGALFRRFFGRGGDSERGRGFRGSPFRLDALPLLPQFDALDGIDDDPDRPADGAGKDALEERGGPL